MKADKIDYHVHRIYCRRKSDLRDLLNGDKLSEFCDKYKTADQIVSAFSARCRTNEFCTRISPIECVLKQNTGKIAHRVITNYGIGIQGFVVLTQKLKSKKKQNMKYDQIKKLFLNSILYSNLTEDEASFILEKLFSLGDWDLIDWFHLYGHKIRNIESILKCINDTNFDKIINAGYHFNENCILKLMTIDCVSFDKIRDLGITEEMIKNPNNRSILLKLYSDENQDGIKYIENNGFEMGEDCLDCAVKGFNFDTILRILQNTEYTLSDKHLSKLLFIPKKEKRQAKKFRVRRYRRSRRFIVRSYHENGKLINKIPNYEKNIINILDNHIANHQKNIVIKSLNKIVPLIIYGHAFVLYDYFKENYFYNIELKKEMIEDLTFSLISKDDIDSLRKMINYKLIVPIDICQSSYMNFALRHNSQKMIDYFNDELNIVCDNSIGRYFYGYRSVENNIDLIKNLEKIEYPIENVINTICQKCSSSDTEYLIDNGYNMPENIVEVLLKNKDYDLAKKMLDSGYKLKLNRLIDKIVKRTYVQRWNSDTITVNQINQLIKLGGTATKNSSNTLAKRGNYKCVIHLYVKFGLVPSQDAVIDNLRGWYSSRGKTSDIIKYLDYVIEVMQIDVFNVDNYVLSDIVERKCNDEQLPLLKYIVDKTNYPLTTQHLDEALDYNDNVETLKYLEEKGVEITKHLLLTSLTRRNMRCSKYIQDKYKFDITLKDIHNLVITHGIYGDEIKLINEITNVKFTPYTVQIFVTRFLNKWDYRQIKYIILDVGKLTQESYDIIMNSDIDKLKDFMGKIKIDIVNYEPTDEELPDQNLIMMHDYDSSGIDSDVELNENDKYIKKVLKEGEISNGDNSNENSDVDHQDNQDDQDYDDIVIESD